MTLVKFDRVSLGYQDVSILHEVNFSIRSGEVCCLLGGNGSGKSTLLRSVAGVLKPLAGEIILAGKKLREWSARQRAGMVAWVPQSHASPFAYSVLDMVMMGSVAGLGRLASPGAKQRQQARDTLAALGIAGLEQRLYSTLSGGQRQLVLIARALVQQPVLMLLDEPASSLDFGHQIALLEKIRQLKVGGMTLLIATHHPVHARIIADRVAFVSPTAGVQVGSPDVMLTSSSLAHLYQVKAEEICRHLNLHDRSREKISC
ncbi:ABC transporter ATP-binding protein [Erwinia papayae]|uniref:ABC transporter ATP-binding protein n=1 Tax=Erwinia papayae TaxID=206499 RepID=A0ABV3N622_9GAMM